MRRDCITHFSVAAVTLLLTCSLWDSNFWNIKKSQKSKAFQEPALFYPWDWFYSMWLLLCLLGPERGVVAMWGLLSKGGNLPGENFSHGSSAAVTQKTSDVPQAGRWGKPEGRTCGLTEPHLSEPPGAPLNFWSEGLGLLSILIWCPPDSHPILGRSTRAQGSPHSGPPGEVSPDLCPHVLSCQEEGTREQGAENLFIILTTNQVCQWMCVEIKDVRIFLRLLWHKIHVHLGTFKIWKWQWYNYTLQSAKPHIDATKSGVLTIIQELL